MLFVAFGLCIAAAPVFAQTADAKKTVSVCKDGTSSTAACAGHRGIDSAATKAAKDAAKAAKAEAKADKAKASKDPNKSASADAKAKAAQAKADKAEDKASHDSTGATAKCKDGTYSHTMTTQGACSRHGGVSKALKP